MKKIIRVGIFVNIKECEYLEQTMALVFGRENVFASPLPQQLFGVLKDFHPTVIIIAPDLFERNRISAEDINALRKQLRYRIIALYANREALEIKEHYENLKPDKEYICPTEFLTMATELRHICTNTYTQRKKPLREQTERNIRRILTDCGFRMKMKGALYLQEALLELYFKPALHNLGGNAQLYRALATRHETTPRIVERAIQRCLEQSLLPHTEETLHEELSIPDFYSLQPVGFGRFTQVFNTYYTIKYGDPEQLLKKK